MDHYLPAFFLSPSVQLIILYIRRLKFGDSNLIVRGALGSYWQFPSRAAFLVLLFLEEKIVKGTD